MSHQPIRHRTLGDYLEAGTSIWVTCRNRPACSHSSVLSLHALIQKFGSDFDATEGREELGAKLKCEKCGTRAPEIRISVRGS